MTFDVRVAMATDLDAVVALEREIAEAPHWRREEYARLLEEESESAMRHVLFVATVGGSETVGFAVGKVIGLGLDSVGALESVAVGEKARRSGVGRALCEAVVGWCRKQGAGVVELEVRRRREGARALYAQLGFVEVGVRSGYYREPDDDAVLMSRVD
jgi:ribosomal-protein-alanine N-acetyltransferase